MESRATNESQLQVVQPTHLTAPSRGPRLGLPTQGELAALMEYGSLVHKSGLFPNVKSAEAAIVMIRMAHQLGIDEFIAMQNMYMIGGKQASMASLLHTLILRDHGGDAVQIVESTPEQCVLSCKRRDAAQRSTVSYTIAEAKQAGVYESNPQWKKYPADMLFARCISRAGRQLFRDSTMGMYTPEELGGNVIEVAGEVIVGEPAATRADDPTDFASTRGRRMPDEKPNRLARLHAIGGERGLDHDALHRVAMLKLGRSLGDPVITETMLGDFERLVETASDEELLLWQLDWSAEIRAAEPRGVAALTELGQRIASAGITKASHPGMAAEFQLAMNRAKAAAPAEPIDAQYRELDGMPANADRFTA